MTGLGSGEHGKGTIVNVSSKGCTSCRMQAVCGRLPFKVTMCLVAVMFASCLKGVQGCDSGAWPAEDFQVMKAEQDKACRHIIQPASWPPGCPPALHLVGGTGSQASMQPSG